MLYKIVFYLKGLLFIAFLLSLKCINILHCKKIIVEPHREINVLRAFRRINISVRMPTKKGHMSSSLFEVFLPLTCSLAREHAVQSHKQWATGKSAKEPD